VVREMGIKVGIVAVPATAAQVVVDELVAAGVEAILNYAPIAVLVPEGVHLQYIDPVAHLQRMSYHLT
jgi:redox-sensing transcriptional repressor